MALSEVMSYRISYHLFNWAEITVEPGQGLLDEFDSGGDMVSFVQLQFRSLLMQAVQAIRIIPDIVEKQRGRSNAFWFYIYYPLFPSRFSNLQRCTPSTIDDGKQGR